MSAKPIPNFREKNRKMPFGQLKGHEKRPKTKKAAF